MSMAMTKPDAGSAEASATVRVWDPLVRLFHWSLVGGFVFAFVTAEEWDNGHIVTGYIVAGLVALRVVWGVIGTRHARFSDFVYRPSKVVRFLKDSLSFRAKRYIGHNPAGGAMMIALLLAIAGISVTGYMMSTDMFWGVEWVEEAHELIVGGTIVLVVLHIAGVILASFEHRENLVRSMITGLKRRE